eukprot:Nk52_evm59s208 gene=Nk52_evmTU59s208
MSSSSSLSLGSRHSMGSIPDTVVKRASVIAQLNDNSLLSLWDILAVYGYPLTEEQLWSLCHSVGESLRVLCGSEGSAGAASGNDDSFVLAPETILFEKDGTIKFDMGVSPKDLSEAETYLAPEVEEKGLLGFDEKVYVYALGATLWNSADYALSDDQEPNISDRLQELISIMTDDDVAERATIEVVLQKCAEASEEGYFGSSLPEEVFRDTVKEVECMRRIVSQYQEAEEEKTEEGTKSMWRALASEIDAGLPRLKNAMDRKLPPRVVSLTPHDKLMNEIRTPISLRKSRRISARGKENSEALNCDDGPSGQSRKLGDEKLEDGKEKEASTAGNSSGDNSSRATPTSSKPKMVLSAKGLLDSLQSIEEQFSQGSPSVQSLLDKKANEDGLNGDSSSDDESDHLAELVAKAITPQTKRKVSKTPADVKVEVAAVSGDSAPEVIEDSVIPSTKGEGANDDTRDGGETSGSMRIPEPEARPRSSSALEPEVSLEAVSSQHSKPSASGMPDEPTSDDHSLNSIPFLVGEIRHIQQNIFKAEQENISDDDPQLGEGMKDGKVCWVCRKTWFGLMNRARRCVVCDYFACYNCVEKMDFVVSKPASAVPGGAVVLATETKSENVCTRCKTMM